MIRLGGAGMGGPGGLPPHDPDAERALANAAVFGNVAIFGAIVFALSVGKPFKSIDKKS